MAPAKDQVANVGIRVGAASAGAYLTNTLGPEGGAAAAESLAQSGEALVGWLEERSRDRVTRTLLAVSKRVAERTARGEIVRDDRVDPGNGDAAALFEAVVEAAAKSAEDRKCDVIANAYVSIAFNEHISIDDALLYVRRIRDSSWRQLVSLQLFVTNDRKDERKSIALGGDRGEVEASSGLAVELTELAETLGFVGVISSGGFVVATPSVISGGDGFRSAYLDKWVPTMLGRKLADLGDLKSVVKKSELDELVRDLGAPADWGY